RSDGRRKRVHPTSEQQRLLEAFFAENPKPNSKRRLEISEAVNINVRSVQIWFQNRRTRLKRQPKLEGEVDE
ncbi:homeobox, partial [Rhizoclosmatium globosum]